VRRPLTTNVVMPPVEVTPAASQANVVVIHTGHIVSSPRHEKNLAPVMEPLGVTCVAGFERIPLT
jgi:hypothetical protein